MGDVVMSNLKKHCPRCGGEIEDGETVCSYCGSKLNPETIIEIETPDKTETPDPDLSHLEFKVCLCDRVNLSSLEVIKEQLSNLLTGMRWRGLE